MKAQETEDAKLIALAALVNAEVAMASIANADRAHRGYAPAYGDDFVPEHYAELHAALRLRDVASR